MVENLAPYRRSIINRSFWIAAGLAIAMSLLHYKNYAVGIIIGTAVSALNFFLLSVQVGKFSQDSKTKRFFVSFLIRYGLLGIVLFLVIKNRDISIIGFLIGYCLLYLQLFLSAFLLRLKAPKAKEVSS